LTDPWDRLAEVVAPQVLLADRPQDRADIKALLQVGIDEATIADFLNRHAPGLVARFAELVSE